MLQEKYQSNKRFNLTHWKGQVEGQVNIIPKPIKLATFSQV